MEKRFARLAKIQLTNAKNVVNGEIEFESIKSFGLDNCQMPSVFAIYGSNGSGKTTIVEAISIAHDLMSGGKIEKFINGFITQWENSASCKYLFMIEGLNEKSFLAEYSVSFTRNEKEDRPVILLHEGLSVKEAVCKDSKVTWKKYISDIDVNYSNLKDMFEETVYERAFGNNSSLAETKTLCKNDLKSFIFSEEFFDVINGKKASKNISKLKETIRLLKGYATFDMFVFSNDDASMSYLNNLVICDRQETDKKIGAGKIQIDINKTGEQPERLYEVLETCIENINNVLPSVISNLKIKIESRGESTDKDGNVLKKFELFSLRGDKKIPFRYESAGIKKIVAICSVLIDVFNDPSVTLAIDEFDSGVFEYLLGQLIKAFDRYARGQIIFTAHNSRALELLPTKQVIFTSTNPNKRFIRMKKVKPTNNLRDFYYRAILLGGQDEELSPETSEIKITRAFSVMRCSQ